MYFTYVAAELSTSSNFVIESWNPDKWTTNYLRKMVSKYVNPELSASMTFTIESWNPRMDDKWAEEDQMGRLRHQF